MPFFADLHIHSRYAYATSRDADLEHIALWAAKKGIDLVGTGDFTHPSWFNELQEQLIPAEEGLFRLRPDLQREVNRKLTDSCPSETRFMLQVEISTIHKKYDRTRKVHHLIYVPHFEAAKNLRRVLGSMGNLNSDGRPILGMDPRDLLEITLECNDQAYLIPAHIWTPWFAVLGSKSGFDSIESCYGDLTPHLFALETGLSSDPQMNRHLSMLDRYQLVSNSDAHSPGRLGREANCFDCPMDYESIRQSLKTGKGLIGTVEFFPEEGKYHMDGCRRCGVCLSPEESKDLEGRCPECRGKITFGVLHRIMELADRTDSVSSTEGPESTLLVPLKEVLSEYLKVGIQSKRVHRYYERLIQSIGPELFILNEADTCSLAREESSGFADGVQRMREGKVSTIPGYDGKFGRVRMFD